MSDQDLASVPRGVMGRGDGDAPADQARVRPCDAAEDGLDRDGVVNLRKLVRLSRMLGYLVSELRQVPLDECGRRHLRDVADQALVESGSAVTDELLEELSRVAAPLDRDATPTRDELRVVQAQLEGWIDGLIVAVEGAAAAQRAVTASQR